jgi:hypothetical protein
MSFNRRRFLTALGLTAGSLVVPSGRRRAAWAAEEATPKRLLILSTNHGVWYDGWKIRTGGEREDAAWSKPLQGLSASDFSEGLRPLHAYRDRMTILDGLSNATAELDLAGIGHAKGPIHAWTGNWAWLEGATWSVGPSIDQIVAAEISRANRLPSLEAAAGIEWRALSHAGIRQQITPETAPQRLYQRIFGLSDATPAELAQFASRGSMLDWVSGEFSQVSAGLAPADRKKLELHFDLVRQLEGRLQGLTDLSCGASLPGPLPTDDALAYDHQMTSFAELIATAFACDATRVASISVGDPPGEVLSGSPASVHNTWAHNVFFDADSRQRMIAYNSFLAERVKTILDLLDAIPEGDGTVLDNTLVVWGSEIADGAHGFEKYGVVLFGGGWAFETGRLVHWPYGTTPVEGWSGSERILNMGLPHQHLLVTIAQAFGLDVDHIGLSSVSGQRGDRIDLTGGLPAPF